MQTTCKLTLIVASSSSEKGLRLNLAGKSAMRVNFSISTFGPMGLATCGATAFAGAAGAACLLAITFGIAVGSAAWPPAALTVQSSKRRPKNGSQGTFHH
jgi:hypothetical protein